MTVKIVVIIIDRDANLESDFNYLPLKGASDSNYQKSQGNNDLETLIKPRYLRPISISKLAAKNIAQNSQTSHKTE